MKKLLFALLGIVTVAVVRLLWWRRESQRRALPCPPWLAWLLENPFMEAIAGTEPTLDRVGVAPGERVLDVGAGPGRLTLPAAERAGPSGSVTAVDIQPAMLERLQQQAAQAGVTNIETRLMDVASGNDLDANSFDRAWLVTVLGEIVEPEAALDNIYRALKPGGTLSITEVLPDPHYQQHGTVLRLAQSAGFQATEYWGNFLAYTQNFVKPTDAAHTGR